MVDTIQAADPVVDPEGEPKTTLCSHDAVLNEIRDLFRKIPSQVGPGWQELAGIHGEAKIHRMDLSKISTEMVRTRMELAEVRSELRRNTMELAEQIQKFRDHYDGGLQILIDGSPY